MDRWTGVDISEFWKEVFPVEPKRRVGGEHNPGKN